MRPLAGDEGIDPRRRSLGNFCASPTGHNPDSTCKDGAPGGEMHAASNGPLQVVAQDLAADLSFETESDFLTECLMKWFAVAEPDRCRKQGVVAEAWVQIQRQVREHQERQAREHQAVQDRSVLAEGLRRLMPNARQCGGCGRGPVDHYACTDLQAHHGQQTGRGRISNACQQCGWFRARIAEWPMWDGRIWD